MPSAATDANVTSGCPYNVNSRAHPLGLPIANDVTTYGCRNGDVFVEGTVKGQVTIAADNNIDITRALQYNGGTGGTDLPGRIANNSSETGHQIKRTTAGSPGVDARKLGAAHYRGCEKTFEGRMPRTEYRLSAAGRRALEKYLVHMEAIIKAVRD